MGNNRVPMKCYLCHQTDVKLVTEELRYQTSRKIYQCLSCGLVFLHPQMTPEEEQLFYEKEYGEIFSKEKGTTPEKLFQARLGDARTYLDWTKEYLRRGDRCLEVGCASGYFLATLRDTVGTVSGIETHHLLRQYCQEIGIPAFQALSDLGSQRFDRVFLFFLLEHLGDPVRFLEEVRRILAPGGLIFVVVPNIDDALLSLYTIPGFRSFYFTPAHQFYYSKTTLSSVLERAGFSEIEIKAKQRYDLSNHMHWMQFGKPGGVGVYNHVFSEALRQRYAQDLMDHFLCDTLLAIAGERAGDA